MRTDHSIVPKTYCIGKPNRERHRAEEKLNGTDIISLRGSGVLPPATLKITSPANNSSFVSGTAVPFAVSVTSTSGPQPTGNVQFKVDGANSGGLVALSSTGTASTSLTGLTTTTHTLSFTYTGDANYAKGGPVSVSITVTAAIPPRHAVDLYQGQVLRSSTMRQISAQ
jgi:hypothetical protein